MMFEEPKVEFVAIDLNENVVTLASTCNDGKTCNDAEAGGTLYCNTSMATEQCGNAQKMTG